MTIYWNKGLTKETDERVRRNAEKVSLALKGKPKSEKHKKTLSKSRKKLFENGNKYGNEIREKLRKNHWSKHGYVAWNKGLTKETDERVAKNGKKESEVKKRLFKEGKIIPTWKGKHLPNKMIEKIKESKKNISDETKEKIRKNHWSKLGYSSWCKGLSREEYLKHFKNNQGSNKGKHPSEETRRKMSEWAKERLKDPRNHPLWRGGISFEPYNLAFNDKLKNQIRKRDNFTCQECGMTEEQLRYILNIHHIDFNKKNTNPNNLISLCRSCHSQTNFNREDWTNYFQNKLEEIKCQSI